MKVSIIIPIYNVSDFIESCISSALNQTYEDIEYILIDDCSPDDSINKAKIIIEKHIRKPFVKIITHNVNKGLSGARNTGIENASGEYLYFLDSDDKIPSNSIKELVNIAIKNYPDFVIGDFKPFGSSLYVFTTQKLGRAYISDNDKIFDLFLNYQWYPMAWNKLVNRKFLIKNKLYFYEGIYHEDLLWSYQLALAANSMATLPTNTYEYRIRENSIMGSKSLKHYNDILVCCNFIKNSVGVQKNKNVATYLETILVMIVYDMFQNKFSKNDLFDMIKYIKNDYNLTPNFPYSIRAFINLIKLPAFFLSKNLSYVYIRVVSKGLNIFKRRNN